MRIKGQKGAAVVEFAVIAPLLLVILFGIIEFSVYFYDKAMITNASREGARRGIVFAPTRPTDQQIRDVVTAYCEDNLISLEGNPILTIDIIPPGNRNALPSLTPLTVTVTYGFEFMVFSRLISLLGGNIADGLPLSAETVMRLE